MPKKEFIPTDKHRKQVESLAGFGLPKEDIALLIENPNTGEGIAKATLEKYFKTELRVGHVKANAAVAQSLFQQAVTDKITTAGIWWSKSRMGWKERTEVELSGSLDIKEVRRTIVRPPKT
jgi:hypothetical protein